MLSDKDLYQKHDTMRELKRQTYEKVLNQCLRSIKVASNKGDLICVFSIPYYVLGAGYPKIEPENCSVYLIEHIGKMNSNIKITFNKPNLLLIDWRK